METSLINCIHVLLYIQITNAQYQNYYYGGMNQAYYPNPEMDYTNMEFRTKRHRGRHGNSGGKLPSIHEDDSSSDDSDDCRESECKCNECEAPRSCCEQVCNNCQMNLLFVPFPYNLMVKISTNTTTTTTTTTTEATTTTKASEEESEDTRALRRKSPGTNRDSKYILTSLRRTKTSWLPNFGIVPIPDQLAESLMSQMRSMKGINSRKGREREK